MGQILLFLYIVLSIVAPAEMFRELAPLRLSFWAGLIGLAVSAFSLIFRGWDFLRSTQFWLILAFSTQLCITMTIIEGYLGAFMEVFSSFGLSVIIFLLIIWNVYSLNRMKWTALAIVLA